MTNGCLAWPLRLLGLAVVVAAGLVAWAYRDEIRRWVHARTAPGEESVGRADPALAPAAWRRLEALRRGGPDSVVLTAAETASLVDQALRRAAPGLADSLEAELGHDEVAVRAVVDARRLRSVLGPLDLVLADRERLEVRGPFVMRRAGEGEWLVRRARLHSLPLPVDLVARLLGRRGAGAAVPIPLPPGVTGLRVTPRGVVLYGTSARGRAP